MNSWGLLCKIDVRDGGGRDSRWRVITLNKEEFGQLPLFPNGVRMSECLVIVQMTNLKWAPQTLHGVQRLSSTLRADARGSL